MDIKIAYNLIKKIKGKQTLGLKSKVS